MKTVQRLFSLVLVLSMFLSLGLQAAAETLTLPSELEAVGEEAFAGDTSLDEVVLPEGMVTIGPRAFAESSVSEIILPTSLTGIADNAFENARPTARTTAGSYAHWWAAAHGLTDALAFRLYEQYDYTTVRAAFSENEEIGLYHSAWIRNYRVGNYEALKKKYGGEPVWSVEFVGDGGGAELRYSFSDYVGGTPEAIDLNIYNEPEVPCTLAYKITCTWGEESITGKGRLVYESVDLPDGIDVQEEYRGLQLNETYSIPMSISPAGYIFGENQNLTFSTEMDCRTWVEQEERLNGRRIEPHETGPFIAWVGIRMGNIHLKKPVRLFVEGVSEGELSEKAAAAKNSNPAFAELTTRRLTVNGIPLYEAYREDGTRKPIVFLIHGISSEGKDTMFPQACKLATLGMYAVAIDIAGLGDSKIGPIDAMLSAMMTIGQIDTLLEYYGANPEANAERFGFFGESMGSIISFGYVAHGKYRPTALALGKGTPDYTTLTGAFIFDHGTYTTGSMMPPEERDAYAWECSPWNYREKFRNLYLYAGNWLADTTVSADGCLALEQYLNQTRGTKHVFRFFKGADHDSPLPISEFDPYSALCWALLENSSGVQEYPLSSGAAATFSDFTGLTARHLRVNGIPLYEVYQNDGQSKPLVILIHGGGGGNKEVMFPAACEYAAQGFYCVAMDAPGCGESEIGPIASVTCFEMTISQIDELIAYYSQSEQADADHFGLAGRSMGANISFAYVIYGKHTPTIIVADRGTPDFSSLPYGPATDVFDHGAAHQPQVMSIEEIEARFAAINPMNHKEAFLDVAIYAGNGLADNTSPSDGCMELERFLDENHGTKHVFQYFEGCDHGDPYPEDYDPIGALRQALLRSDTGPFTRAQS